MAGLKSVAPLKQELLLHKQECHVMWPQGEVGLLPRGKLLQQLLNTSSGGDLVLLRPDLQRGQDDVHIETAEHLK